MTTLECKDFLKFEAEISNDILTLIKTLKIVEPYEYTCFLDTDINLNSLTSQQATNIVRKIIEERENGNSIFWYHRSDAHEDENYIEGKLGKLSKSEKEKVIPECIDDYIELPVNHADKPDKLLNLIANRLSNVSATAHYQIKPKDFIRCNIPIEPYGDKSWYSDEGNKIIDDLQDSSFLLKYWNVHESIGNAKSFGIFPPAQKMWEVSLTMHGWKILSSLNVERSNKVFIAMAFSGWENEEKRRNLVKAIQAACNKYGYDANIVDQNHTVNIIDRIISEIRQAKFVICDFTHDSSGAYYEAGYARALGKSVYHLVEKDYFHKLHFDIQQINCRTWKTPDEAKIVLEEWIGANERNIKHNYMRKIQ